jgi:FixJ family two-component response regulator
VSPGNFIVYTLVGSPELRDSVQAAAWSGGFTPLVFHSAGEYLSSPESDVPGCLILSINLPDMSGADLQARIANEGPAIVFVSDRVDLPQSIRAVKAGAVDFLTMPLDPRALVRAVHSALELDGDRRAARARIAELQRRYLTLTTRECELFPLITEGLLNKQVASKLGISPMTVQIHRGRIMRKMAARSFAELVRFADALNVGRAFARTCSGGKTMAAAPRSAATVGTQALPRVIR